VDKITFYDQIKSKLKRNHIKQKRDNNFEIKYNNTKTVTNNNRISIKHVIALSLKKFEIRVYNGSYETPTIVVTPQLLK